MSKSYSIGDNPNKYLFEKFKGQKFRRLSKYGKSEDVSTVKDIFYISNFDHKSGCVKIQVVIKSDNNNIYNLNEVLFTDNEFFGIRVLSEKEERGVMMRVEEHEKRRQEIRNKLKNI